MPPGSGEQHSSLQAFVPAGRGRRAKEKVCGSSLCAGRSAFKTDIPGPASLWHFPEKVKGEKTLHQPTQPPTHSVFSDSCFLWGLSWARAPDPCPRGPILPPTEEVWGVGEWGGDSRRVQSLKCVGCTGEGRGVSSRQFYVESTSVPSFELEGREGGDLTCSQSSPLTPSPQTLLCWGCSGNSLYVP